MINFSSTEEGFLPRRLANGARYLSVFSSSDATVYPNETITLRLGFSLTHSDRYSVLVAANPILLGRDLIVLNSVLYPAPETTIMVKNCHYDKVIIKKYSPIASIFIVQDSTVDLVHSGKAKFEVINDTNR